MTKKTVITNIFFKLAPLFFLTYKCLLLINMTPFLNRLK